jgi:hypothetical protein
MLTQEEDVELSALVWRGWKISQIARHLGSDRKTVRAYVRGEREPGRRKSLAHVDSLEPYAEYVGIRQRDDPHLWASTQTVVSDRLATFNVIWRLQSSPLVARYCWTWNGAGCCAVCADLPVGGALRRRSGSLVAS